MSRSILLVYSLSWALGCIGQTVVIPEGQVALPPGKWADTVFVAFDARNPIGVIRTPTGPRPESLYLPGNPATAIKRTLGEELDATPGADRLFLKVNRLQLGEERGVAICSMHAEVLNGSNGHYTRIYEGPASIRGGRSRDVLKGNGAIIVSVLQEFMNEFKERSERGELVDIAVPADRLGTPMMVSEIEAPILAATTPRRGIYRSFLQMRLNMPDSLTAFELIGTEAWQEPSGPVRMKSDPNTSLDSIWGLSDGVHPYIRSGEAFLHLELRSGGFQALAPIPVDPDPLMVASMTFGLGLVGAAIIFAQPRTTASMIFDLDLLTGELVPRSTLFADPPSTVHVFRFDRTSKTDDAIRIELPERPPIILQKGQWTSLDLPLRETPTEVTITGPRDSMTVSLSTTIERTEIHDMNLSRDGDLKINRLHENARLTVLHQLNEADRVP
ncbi:MAG TPA: hypothetical protein PLL57_14340 [Flavobacteriales bacterium]|nr:hypothetical protein [Flavobacteriales bacterium]